MSIEKTVTAALSAVNARLHVANQADKAIKKITEFWYTAEMPDWSDWVATIKKLKLPKELETKLTSELNTFWNTFEAPDESDLIEVIESVLGKRTPSESDEEKQSKELNKQLRYVQEQLKKHGFTTVMRGSKLVGAGGKGSQYRIEFEPWSNGKVALVAHGDWGYAGQGEYEGDIDKVITDFVESVKEAHPQNNPFVVTAALNALRQANEIGPVLKWTGDEDQKYAKGKEGYEFHASKDGNKWGLNYTEGKDSGLRSIKLSTWEKVVIFSELIYSRRFRHRFDPSFVFWSEKAAKYPEMGFATY